MAKKNYTEFDRGYATAVEEMRTLLGQRVSAFHAVNQLAKKARMDAIASARAESQPEESTTAETK